MFSRSLYLLCIVIPATLAVKCHLCTDPNGDCTSKQPCEGNWCTHQIVHSEDTTLVSKGCSPTNVLPSGQDDCLKTPPLGGRENVNCFCNSTDYCNTVEFIKKKFPKVLEFQVKSADAGKSSGNDAKSANGSSSDAGSGSGGDVSCFECQSVTGDCATGKCKGNFCSAKIVKNDKEGKLIVTKGCEDRNIIDKTTDTCISAETPDSTNIICTCKSGANCNNKDNLDKLYAATANGDKIFSGSNAGGKSSAPVGTAEPAPEPTGGKNNTDGAKSEPEPAAGGKNGTAAAEPEPEPKATVTPVQGGNNGTKPEPGPAGPTKGKKPQTGPDAAPQSGNGAAGVTVSILLGFCLALML